jgi:hypothetical protein
MGLFKSLGFASKKDKNLAQTGLRLDAVIVDVAVNNSVTINGRNPRKLVCEGTLPNGEKKFFESSNVSPLIPPDVVGRPISVFIDPNDSSKYYVDAEDYK